jgi:hypothetical protein
MELYGDDLMEFFQRVEVANFEIASDAFSSFKVRRQQQQQTNVHNSLAVISSSSSSNSSRLRAMPLRVSAGV